VWRGSFMRRPAKSARSVVGFRKVGPDRAGSDRCASTGLAPDRRDRVTPSRRRRPDHRDLRSPRRYGYRAACPRRRRSRR